MKTHYIQSVVTLLNEGKDIMQVLVGLEKSLKRHGRSKLYRSILVGVLKHLKGRRSGKAATVTLVNISELKIHKEAIERELAVLGAPREYEALEDPTLIGGSVIYFNNNMRDRSYKRKLISLYRSALK